MPGSSSPPEIVVDVPPKLTARARPLDNNHSDNADTHDGRSTASVALRNGRLPQTGPEASGIRAM